MRGPPALPRRLGVRGRGLPDAHRDQRDDRSPAPPTFPQTSRADRILDKALVLEELRGRRVRMISHYTDELAENDVIRILKRAFKGRNRKRNILIFLLHFRQRLTPQEIAEIDLFELRPSTGSHILTEMRDKIREEMFVEKLQ